MSEITRVLNTSYSHHHVWYTRKGAMLLFYSDGDLITILAQFLSFELDKHKHTSGLELPCYSFSSAFLSHVPLLLIIVLQRREMKVCKSTKRRKRRRWKKIIKLLVFCLKRPHVYNITGYFVIIENIIPHLIPFPLVFLACLYYGFISFAQQARQERVTSNFLSGNDPRSQQTSVQWMVSSTHTYYTANWQNTSL